MANAPTKKPADAALGRVLRKARGDESQESVGFRAGVTAGTIGRIEMGTSRPEWGTVRDIATALGISLAELAIAVEKEERAA